jgi:broad specificity phosphatase PhoE
MLKKEIILKIRPVRKGLERAKLWNEIFAEINFDQIYATDYKRTVQTARVTALQKIEIKLYNPKNIIKMISLKKL